MKGCILVSLLVSSVLCAQPQPAEPPQPKLNINTASPADLDRLPGIGPDRAEWIVETRRKNGPFRCVEELQAMPRLSERQFNALRRYVFVAAPDPRCEATPRAKP